jgi:hypothetical protein
MSDDMYDLVSAGFKLALLWVVFDDNGHYKLTAGDIIDLSFSENKASKKLLREQVKSLVEKIM